MPRLTAPAIARFLTITEQSVRAVAILRAFRNREAGIFLFTAEFPRPTLYDKGYADSIMAEVIA